MENRKYSFTLKNWLAFIAHLFLVAMSHYTNIIHLEDTVAWISSLTPQ